jgi:hypothetical protein
MKLARVLYGSKPCFRSREALKGLLSRHGPSRILCHGTDQETIWLVGIAHWSELGQSNDAYQMIFTTHPPPEHKAPGLEQREWGLKKLSPHNVPLLSLSSPLPNGRAP